MRQFGTALRACPAALTVGSAILALLTFPCIAGAPAHSERSPATVPAGTGVPRLHLDPSSWWMVDGNSTPLTATWIGIPPGCGLVSEWFHWFLENDSDGATLSSVGGVSTVLTSGSDADGVATAAVDAVGSLDCGTSTVQIVASAESNVTIVAPLTIDGFAPLANPISPGTNASLTARISGGQPPYSYRLEWGDGAVTAGTIGGAGSIEVNHSFSTGEYLAEITVWDVTGLFAQSGLAATLNVGSALTVGILANRSATDVGIPVGFNATALEAPAGSTSDWDCPQDAARVSSAISETTHFECTFPRAGSGAATYYVFPPGGVTPKSTSYPIRVVTAPSLTAPIANLTAEAGQPAWAEFNLSGGVPPFNLTWVETGAHDSGSLQVPCDGVVTVPLRTTSPGDFGLSARSTDSDGATTEDSSVRIVVQPALTASLSDARSLSPSGAILNLSIAISEGSAPYSWFVGAGLVPINESSPNGTLASVGSVSWTGVYNSTGAATAQVVVVDASGAVWSGAVLFEALPPFTIRSEVISGPLVPRGTFEVRFDFSGGLPPFSIEIDGGDGQVWNRSWGEDGNFSSTCSSASFGNISLNISVRDSAGEVVESSGVARVLASGASSEPPGPAPDVGWVILGSASLLGLSVCGYLLWRRGRPRTLPRPPPDAVGVLRKIIEPADGADRTTVELLAEESGVPLELARSTLDRLISDGTVLREPTPDGGEVVSWSRFTSK
jgi:hypothetical protein